MPNKPPTFPNQPWTRSQPKGYTTLPVVASVLPASGRLAGGTAVTITGKYFRNNADGTAPSVLFGGLPATSVVVTSSTTITCNVPAGAAAGAVSVSVTVGTQTGSLISGFVYVTSQLISVDPAFLPLAGGNVVIKGTSFVTGSSVTFGGASASAVTFIDETSIAVTVPAHAVGFVDVVVTEPLGASSTLRNGFQYTQLVRGSDIRRNPGITVQKSTGTQANQASFTIDGGSNKPVPGEEITIVDSFDGNRELFAGVIVTADQNYEGLITQLAWNCTAKDFVYFLNKYRPFGSYTNVSASEVVRDLMGKYAPAFSSAFVQTKLALVSFTFDGSRTMSECLDAIAAAIGGGRWYLDRRTLHFFHPPLPDDIVLPPDLPGGADFTAAVLSTGAATNSPSRYAAGYYAVRCTFLYSNGTESRLGPASNVFPYDGSKYMHIGSLPIGANPSGTITCVGRKIYYYKGRDPIASGWTVNDNATGAIDVLPVVGPDVAPVDNNIGDPVTVFDGGGPGTTYPPPAPGDSSFGCPIHPPSVYGTNGQLIVGGNVSGPGNAISNAFQIPMSLAYGLYKFRFAVAFNDGSVSQVSQSSSPPVTCGALDGGPQVIGGTGTSYSPWIDNAPDFNGINFPARANVFPVAYLFYAGLWKRYHALAGGGEFLEGPAFGDDPGAFAFVGSCPYFKKLLNDHTPEDPLNPGVPLPTDIPTTTPTDPDYGDKPVFDPNNPLQTLIWPNPDGPYLENFTPPDDLNNTTNTTMLRDGDGSQPFRSTDDVTQLRNRVKVFGAGTSVTATAAIGANQIRVADSSVFSIMGGTVIAGNGVLAKFFSVSSLPTGDFVLLSTPLTAVIPEGMPLQYYAMAEDKDSQRKRGLIELDVNGNPTDGVHEYVVNDTSLGTPQEVYLRAHAELYLFSKPATTITYSTRDTKTRVGATVHVDMTNPPCQGDFLIQSVTIDQMHDDADNLMPRYTVQASNARYDLNAFLLAINPGGTQSSLPGGGGGNNTGLVPTATTDATTNSTAFMAQPGGSFASGKRVVYIQSVNATTQSLVTVGQGAATVTGGAALQDNDGYWHEIRTSVGSSGVISGSAIFTRIELLPVIRARIRTPLDNANGSNNLPIRVMMGWNENFAGVNTDTPSLTTQRGIYLRYSTSVPDNGWVLQTVDSVGRTVSAVITPYAKNTIYYIEIAVLKNVTDGATTYSVKATINGASVTVTTNIPLTLNHGFDMAIQAASNPKNAALDIESIYLESN